MAKLPVIVWFQKDVKSISLSTNSKGDELRLVFQKDVKSISLSTHDLLLK